MVLKYKYKVFPEHCSLDRGQSHFEPSLLTLEKGDFLHIYLLTFGSTGFSGDRTTNA